MKEQNGLKISKLAAANIEGGSGSESIVENPTQSITEFIEVEKQKALKADLERFKLRENIHLYKETENKILNRDLEINYLTNEKSPNRELL